MTPRIKTAAVVLGAAFALAACGGASEGADWDDDWDDDGEEYAQVCVDVDGNRVADSECQADAYDASYGYYWYYFPVYYAVPGYGQRVDLKSGYTKAKMPTGARISTARPPATGGAVHPRPAQQQRPPAATAPARPGAPAPRQQQAQQPRPAQPQPARPAQPAPRPK